MRDSGRRARTCHARRASRAARGAVPPARSEPSRSWAAPPKVAAVGALHQIGGQPCKRSGEVLLTTAAVIGSNLRLRRTLNRLTDAAPCARAQGLMDGPWGNGWRRRLVAAFCSSTAARQPGAPAVAGDKANDHVVGGEEVRERQRAPIRSACPDLTLSFGPVERCQ